MIGLGSTRTTNVQSLVFWCASVAVQLTTVSPSGNVLPEAGMHWTEAPGQLSEKSGAG